MRNIFQSLYRSPLKTGLTLLLLTAVVFMFTYNLAEYKVADRQYQEARNRYQGVLTVEEVLMPENTDSGDYFLLTDKSWEAETWGQFSYEDLHQQSLGAELIKKLATLPHISRVEKRYLTAGVSPKYTRLDNDHNFFPYMGRCVLLATVKDRFSAYLTASPLFMRDWDNLEFATLTDLQVLAGDPGWFREGIDQAVFLQILKEEYRDTFFTYADSDYLSRDCMRVVNNRLFPGDADALQPGRRFVLVLRNNSVEQVIKPVPAEQNLFPYNLGHQLDVGDDTLLNWWPYFTDVTSQQEGWLETDDFAALRELIQVTNDDVHTFDVVYGDDMAAQRRVVEGRIICEEGRFITPVDMGQPVCVVSTGFLEMSGLKVGDALTLNLGNYLSEQYAPLGAVASIRERSSSEYTEQTFTIIGSWRDLNEGNHVYRDQFWCWSDNAIFVPSAFLPECRNAESHEFKPSEVSFVVGNAEEIIPFMEDCLPVLDEMGLNYVFSDGGWSAIGQDLMQARSLALVKMLAFGGAAVFALVLTVWLFIGRKKREYAIYRALGMPQRRASIQLYAPFLVLGAVSAVVGTVAARMFSLRQFMSSGEVVTTYVPARSELYVMGALGFLVVLAALAWCGVLLIRRKSVLELLNGEGGRRKNVVREMETIDQHSSSLGAACFHKDLGDSRGKNWMGRYLHRLLGRNFGRSVLNFGLALLLAFAFGLVTVLRGIYTEAYNNVEVKPVISGGLNYDRAVKIAESGYVRDPFFEFTSATGQIEMEDATIVLTNRLDHFTQDPVEWLPGWDEESAMNAEDKVLVLHAAHAEKLGVKLGDKVRVNESNWWLVLTSYGMNPLKEGETPMERRDEKRPFFKVVGIIQSELSSATAYIPTAARWTVTFLTPKLELDIAEYTLVDYHQAAAFSDYVKGQLDRNQSAVKFTMDTSYADRMYKIHRLIESLYPLAVAAALLLGGVLPGLIVLHSSREISILRALGVRARDCVILYTLSQVLCALAGLVLGIAAVLVALRPELGEVIVPFAIYLAAHLAACAIGSGIFAWLCARKRVLEQLQAKE
jgi:ABC-type lipoprotein release transport system permease subunit